MVALSSYIRARPFRVGIATLILIALAPVGAIEAIYRVRLASIPERPAMTATPRLYPVHRLVWESTESAPLIMDPIWPWTLVAEIASIASGRPQRRRGATVAHRVAQLHLAALREAGLIPQRSNPHWLTAYVLTIWVTRTMTAEQAIVWYLDHARYGPRARGIEEASAVFFGTRAAQLALLESALVPGMLLHPRRYDPACEVDRALDYRAGVLERLRGDDGPERGCRAGDRGANRAAARQTAPARFALSYTRGMGSVQGAAEVSPGT